MRAAPGMDFSERTATNLLHFRKMVFFQTERQPYEKKNATAKIIKSVISNSFDFVYVLHTSSPGQWSLCIALPEVVFPFLTLLPFVSHLKKTISDLFKVNRLLLSDKCVQAFDTHTDLGLQLDTICGAT